MMKRIATEGTMVRVLSTLRATTTLSVATAEPIKHELDHVPRGLRQGFLATSFSRADKSEVRCVLNDEDQRRVSKTCRPDALCEFDALFHEDDDETAIVTKIVGVRSFVH